ncbi:MAG: MBL fold metallo-hydrolase [Terriglobia bacterium]
MHRNQKFMMAALVLILLGLWLGRSNDPVQATPNSVSQIGQGVWFREGDLKGKGNCNNIWIEMKDYLIVVDANFPNGAEACLADIKKTSSKPVKYVFDTHHHGDHAYGNPVWTRQGATTLAYVGVVEEMKRYEPARWLDTAKTREDVAALNLPTAEPPQQTFSENKFVIEDSTHRVEFHFFGWAHTRGDGFVYLPKEKIICTGDAVVNGPYNYMSDGNVGNWPDVINHALKLDVKTVLPGHGVPGSRDVLLGEKRFILELQKSVHTAIKSGKKLEDLGTLKDGKLNSTALKLPESVANWVGDFFPSQVEAVYKEITLGKPAGEIYSGK